MPPYTVDSPAKKQSKWSAEEDALIIELRGSGMKWEDISKRLPGRSAISCRLHYQNYLERRSEWDEERKNKLARLYERFKPEMWAKVAEEMQVPWRAAEAMHWQLGETDMARRAGVTPFSLTATAIDSSSSAQHRRSPSRPQHQQQHHQQQQQTAHSHHSYQGFMRAETAGVAASSTGMPVSSQHYAPHPPLPPPPPMSYGDRSMAGTGGPGPGPGPTAPRSLSSGRRDDTGPVPRSMLTGVGGAAGGLSDPANAMYHYQHQQQHYQQLGPGPGSGPGPGPGPSAGPGPGLPPIHTGGTPAMQATERMGGSSGGGALPSLAEITTGVSPYNTPAYSLGASPAPSQTASPGPPARPTLGPGPSGSMLPGLSYTPGYGNTGSDPATPSHKRRGSPDLEQREPRRRQLLSPRFDDGPGSRGGGSRGSSHRGGSAGSH